jgi:hypothetical protein
MDRGLVVRYMTSLLRAPHGRATLRALVEIRKIGRTETHLSPMSLPTNARCSTQVLMSERITSILEDMRSNTRILDAHYGLDNTLDTLDTLESRSG